jgi:hypothetical protein
MTEPKEILVCAAYRDDGPIPDEDEGPHDQRNHASDIEDLVEIRAPACEPENEVIEGRWQEPFGAEHDGREPDEVPIILLCGEE